MPNCKERNLQKYKIKNFYDNKMPNRSFPVQDCRHVATAKSYLGRSKFSDSTKKKIAACINRKAKKLGCNVTKKAKASEDYFPTFKELSHEEKLLYLSDDFYTTRELVEASIKKPGMDIDYYII
jgi:hypothetical protein